MAFPSQGLPFAPSSFCYSLQLPSLSLQGVHSMPPVKYVVFSFFPSLLVIEPPFAHLPSCLFSFFFIFPFSFAS